MIIIRIKIKTIKYKEQKSIGLRAGNSVKIRNCLATVWGAYPL